MGKRGLKRMAALFWLAGGLSLAIKGTSLLAAAAALQVDGWGPWWAVAAGATAGLLKCHYLFTPSCRRNLERIDALRYPGAWQFFRKKFFFFLAIMIVAGVTLSRLVQGHYWGVVAIAALDISLAIALLGSARIFLQRPHRIL